MPLIGALRLLIGSLGSLIGNQACISLYFLGAFSYLFPNSLDTQEQRMKTARGSTLTKLDLAHLCAIYLRAQFQNKLNARSSAASETPLDPPLLLPVTLVSELDIIAATLVDAFFNRS